LPEAICQAKPEAVYDA
jgi:hypothetical protein